MVNIDQINFQNKRVVIRVDFNVPLDDDFNITDDTRMRAALPTINKVLNDNGMVVLMSHLGRPKKNPDPKFSIKPIIKHLEELLGRPVQFADDCMKAADKVNALKPGEVLVLENLRFYAEEEGKPRGIEKGEEGYDEAKKAIKASQKEFTKTLASYGEYYINDAFGTAHRAHASTAVIADYLKPAVSGFLLEKELKVLGDAVDNPVRPFVAILGGAKVSDKLAVVKNLLQKVDTLIVGGGMAYTFKKAQGMKVGASLCEDDQLAYAKEMLDAAAAKGVKFLLPVDNVIADKFPAEKDASDIQMQVAEGDIPDGWMGLDIGPKTVALFSDAIKGAKTVVWNGPMGCFEFAPLAKGTFGVCDAVATVKANGGTSIIGGGDSVSAVKKSGKAAEMTHISTGGGASLEYLEGKVLPGVAALNEK